MATGAHIQKGQPGPTCLSLSFSVQIHALAHIPTEWRSSFATHLEHHVVLFLGYKITDRIHYWQ